MAQSPAAKHALQPFT